MFPAREMAEEVAAFVRGGWKRDAPWLKNGRGAGELLRWSETSAFAHLGEYHVLSGDRRTAELARELIETICSVHASLPPPRADRFGVDYTGRLRGWHDSLLLGQLTYVLWGIQPSGVVSDRFLRDFAGTFAREILETNTRPAFSYLHDKYHNALTDLYETMVLAGHLLGPHLKVRDRLGAETVWDAQGLLDAAWSGPKGATFFIPNAFDEHGTYWELSSSYARHSLQFLLPLVMVMRVRGATVEPFLLRRLAQAIRQHVDGIFPDGELPPVNESWTGHHPCPFVVEVGAWLTGDAHLRNRLPLLDELRWKTPLPHHCHWSKFIHRLFLPATRPGRRKIQRAWGDRLEPSSGQLLARSPSGVSALHLNWDAVQDYHSDRDALSWCLQYRGKLRVWDSGYFSGHSRRPWVRRAGSHNTVTINDEDQDSACVFGRIESHLSTPAWTWIRVRAPHVYDGVRTYRRSLLFLKGDPALVLDLFEVEGGWKHQWALHVTGRGALVPRASGNPCRAQWRDDDGMETAALVRCDETARAALEPALPGLDARFRKLTVTRMGASALRTRFASIVAFGPRPLLQEVHARISFDDSSVTLSATVGRKGSRVELRLPGEGAPVLRLGSRVRSFAPWRGRQPGLSRPIFFKVATVEDGRTVTTPCMACWPVERGMRIRIRGRAGTLSAWQFSAPPLRFHTERSAFEPRRLRLRFREEKLFRRSDVGATLWLMPPTLP